MSSGWKWGSSASSERKECSSASSEWRRVSALDGRKKWIVASRGLCGENGCEWGVGLGGGVV